MASMLASRDAAPIIAAAGKINRIGCPPCLKRWTPPLSSWRLAGFFVDIEAEVEQPHTADDARMASFRLTLNPWLSKHYTVEQMLYPRAAWPRSRSVICRGLANDA